MSSYPPSPAALPAAVADSHCHLDLGYDADPPTVAEAVSAAAAVGVQAIIQVGCDVASSQWAAQVALEHPHVWASVALHPNEAPRIATEHGTDALEAAWLQIGELATLPQVRAVGETGMDFYRTAPDGRAVQEESFRRHIRVAHETGKALVIHDREAHADVLRVIDDEGAPDTVVMHCFSGDAAFARDVTERGFYCSFAGVLTFKNADALRDALRVVPTDRILVETDAPFLTPVPHRGKPNASYLVPLTVRAIADGRDWDLTDTCELLMANTERAFGPL